MGLLGWLSVALFSGCGEVHRAFEEIQVSTPSPDSTSAAQVRYEEGQGSPHCIEVDGSYRASARGYLLRATGEIWASARSDRAFHWKSATRTQFRAAPELFRTGDSAVFFTRDRNTITWDIEWHHRLLEGTEAEPALVKIAYAMVRSDTVPFLTPLVEWKGAVFLRSVAPDVTATQIENHISGHVDCDDSSGAVVDLFASLLNG